MNSPTEAHQSASIHYRLLRIALEQFGKPPQDLDSEAYARVKSIAAREYLLEQAVLASQEAADIQVPPSQVDKAVEQIAVRYSDEEAFCRELAANHLRRPDLKVALQRELGVDAVLALVASRAPRLDDTEVRLFYYMNHERFRRPEIRTARHILVTLNPDYPENTRAAVSRRMAQIHKRLLKKPERFAEQALKHSECPTSVQGGLLGEVKQGTLYQQLDEALFRMQPGQVSEVLESPLGLHILLCEAVQTAGIAPLEEIVDKLREQLQEKQRSRFTREWIQQLLRAHAEQQQPLKTRESA